jgi:hypothetical protein
MPVSDRDIIASADYSELFMHGEQPSGVIIMPANIAVDDAFLEKLCPGLSTRVKRYITRQGSKAVDQDEVEDKAVRGPGRPRKED